MDVKKIFSKLKIESKLDSYANLYKELDLNVGSANSAIKRNSISGALLEKIIYFCAKKSIDLNYIFLGENELKKKANVVQKLNYIESEIHQIRQEIRV